MRALGIVLLAFAAQGLPALAAPALTVNDACDGGLLGTLAENSASVDFLSCPSGQTVHTEIRGSGAPVMVSLDVDQVHGTMTIRVAGVEVTASNTAAELSQMRAVLDTPEARLVEHHLWRQLLRAGRSPADRAMAGMASIMVVFEGISAPSPLGNDCYGCCGPGCDGCTGCYTTACAAHDSCVAMYGWGAPVCNVALVAAAMSAWCCQGAKLGPIC